MAIAQDPGDAPAGGVQPVRRVGGVAEHQAGRPGPVPVPGQRFPRPLVWAGVALVAAGLAFGLRPDQRLRATPQ